MYGMCAYDKAVDAWSTLQSLTACCLLIRTEATAAMQSHHGSQSYPTPTLPQTMTQQGSMPAPCSWLPPPHAPTAYMGGAKPMPSPSSQFPGLGAMPPPQRKKFPTQSRAPPQHSDPARGREQRPTRVASQPTQPVFRPFELQRSGVVAEVDGGRSASSGELYRSKLNANFQGSVQKVMGELKRQGDNIEGLRERMGVFENKQSELAVEGAKRDMVLLQRIQELVTEVKALHKDQTTEKQMVCRSTEEIRQDTQQILQELEQIREKPRVFLSREESPQIKKINPPPNLEDVEKRSSPTEKTVTQSEQVLRGRTRRRQQRKQPVSTPTFGRITRARAKRM